jgi:hypothetical protein
MTDNVPTLFFIEDNTGLQRSIRRALTNCNVIQVHSFEEFLEMLPKYLSTITHVIVDGVVPRVRQGWNDQLKEVSTVNGADIVARLREAGFRGPIAAFAEDPDDQARMLRTGCQTGIAKRHRPVEDIVADIQAFLSTSVP